MIRTAAPAAADGAAPAVEGPAEETILTTPTDGVASWSTEKIEPFAQAANQHIIVKEVGKPLWEIFRSISITLLSTHMAAWDWLLYVAEHKEDGPLANQNVLIKTIDGVGGYTGMQFYNDNHYLYATKINTIMLKLLSAGSTHAPYSSARPPRASRDHCYTRRSTSTWASF